MERLTLVRIQVGRRSLDGEWKDGKKNGRGVLTYASGDKYDGEWKDNKQQGCGVYMRADGSIWHGGLWENDQPKK